MCSVFCASASCAIPRGAELAVSRLGNDKLSSWGRGALPFAWAEEVNWLSWGPEDAAVARKGSESPRGGLEAGRCPSGRWQALQVPGQGEPGAGQRSIIEGGGHMPVLPAAGFLSLQSPVTSWDQVPASRLVNY